MSLIEKIKSFFSRKKRHQAVLKFRTDKEKVLSEKKVDALVFDQEVLSGEKEELNKTTKIISPKKFSKKKNKILHPKLEKKEEIRKISSKDDLYELFTGEKNPGINEYTPTQANQLMVPGKNCRKHAKLRQKKVVDLHGLSFYEASQKIENSFIAARLKGTGSIQFITGKGKHSKNMKPVLRSLAEKKAIEFKKDGKICSFEWEKKHKKKSGSIIIYL